MKRIILIFFIATSAVQCMAQGAYLEFGITANSQSMGSMKTYYQDGNTRSENHMAVAQMGGNLDMIMLYLKATPTVSYMLRESDKTYTEINIPKVQSDDKTEYEVTIIGKEKVNGYNTTHLKIKQKGGTLEREIWNSTEVANYAKYKEANNKYLSYSLFKAMAAKGADGFPVKIKTGENGHVLEINLIKSELRNNPSSMFSLSGYTKGSQSAADVYKQNAQEMMQKMQSMTPEQRQKAIDEMKKQYETK